MWWKDSVSTFLVGLVYIAILYVLVRPGSDAVTVIQGVTTGVTNLISAATGGGSFSSSGTATASVPASATGTSQVVS